MITRKRPITRKPRRARRGTAAAELAVCLPIVTLFVFATIEACTMVYLKQSATIAAYEGARTALLPGATATSITANANQVLSDRKVKGGTPAVTPLNIETVPVGGYIRIEVTAPCEQNTLLGTWFYGGRSVTGAAEIMKEF